MGTVHRTLYAAVVKFDSSNSQSYACTRTRVCVENTTTYLLCSSISFASASPTIHPRTCTPRHATPHRAVGIAKTI